MGFLPQFYIIKDAILYETGLTADTYGHSVSLRETIVSVKNTKYSSIYMDASSSATIQVPTITGMFTFASAYTRNIFNIDETYPISIYLSEDSNEDKLVVNNLDHIVAKSYINCFKTFENGKVYANITYTNSGAPIDIVTVRIAINVSTASNVKDNFIIYSESIDPITIGTGETVQIKIEV